MFLLILAGHWVGFSLLITFILLLIITDKRPHLQVPAPATPERHESLASEKAEVSDLFNIYIFFILKMHEI